MVQIVVVLLCTTAYAIVRYAVFGGVDPVHIPVYLINKSVSMAAVVLLFLAGVQHFKGRGQRTMFYGKASFHCAMLHIVLSVVILSSAYFPKFFGDGKMNLVGEITMLSGALATYGYWLIRGGKSLMVSPRVVLLFIGVSLGVHTFAMGYAGWLKPGDWYGGMPPISLISFIFVVLSTVLFLKPQSPAPAPASSH